MDDILASIRRILNEDEAAAQSAEVEKPSSPKAPAAEKPEAPPSPNASTPEFTPPRQWRRRPWYVRGQSL